METLNHSNIKSLYQVLGTSKQIHLLSENAPEGNVLNQIVEKGMLQKEEPKTIFGHIWASVKHCHKNWTYPSRHKIPEYPQRSCGYCKIHRPHQPINADTASHWNGSMGPRILCSRAHTRRATGWQGGRCVECGHATLLYHHRVPFLQWKHHDRDQK